MLTGLSSLASAPVAVGASTPASPTPSVSSSASASRTASLDQQQQQFRAYVTMVTIDGSGLVAGIVQLRSCNSSREACRSALDRLSQIVTGFEADLDKTPPPACLSDVDSQIRSGLGFYDRGLAIVRQGGDTRDQLKVIQGTILISVGTWKLGVAIQRARQSQC